MSDRPIYCGRCRMDTNGCECVTVWPCSDQNGEMAYHPECDELHVGWAVRTDPEVAALLAEGSSCHRGGTTVFVRTRAQIGMFKTALLLEHLGRSGSGWPACEHGDCPQRARWLNVPAEATGPNALCEAHYEELMGGAQ